MYEYIYIMYFTRPVMSDPEQNIQFRTPQPYRPGMKRGSVRTLHDSK